MAMAGGRQLLYQAVDAEVPIERHSSQRDQG